MLKDTIRRSGVRTLDLSAIAPESEALPLSHCGPKMQNVHINYILHSIYKGDGFSGHFSRIFEINHFWFVVAIFDLLHDVEGIMSYVN